LVPVWPGVLVVEANGMAELMDHNTIIDTAWSQWHSLRLVPPR
jgi:hypothetical protein